MILKVYLAKNVIILPLEKTVLIFYYLLQYLKAKAQKRRLGIFKLVPVFL